MILMFLILFSVVNVGWAASPVDGTGQEEQQQPFKLGVETLLEDQIDLIRGKRVGLITNPTGVDRELNSIVDLLYNHPEVNLKALYGPEHGVRGTAQAGAYVESYIDEMTGLPVYSLYGKTRKPTPEMLQNIDVLLFDIQDVGTRFYTYIYTMAYAMEAAKENNIKFIVLDRPNPLGGTKVEGPVLEKGYESFIGMYAIPLRHGMTVGELALLFNQQFQIGSDLTVVKMKGWDRNSYYDEIDSEQPLDWILPSPNMPTLDTAIVYPGAAFFEGTNASEGRGTTRPFELIGAPFMNGTDLARNLNDLNLPGVQFRNACFTPIISKHANVLSCGIQIYVTDRQAYQPIETGLHIVKKVYDMYPTKLTFTSHFNLLIGNGWVVNEIKNGTSVEAIVNDSRWTSGLEAFMPIRSKYLLYGSEAEQVISWYKPKQSSPVIGTGTAASVGMRQEPLDQIDGAINKHINNRLLPGAEVLVARSGTIVKHDAYGHAYRYEDDKFKQASDPVVMQKNTIFDIASISKVFTSTAVLKLLEDGLIRSVDDPVVQYIPEFAVNGKEHVTIKQLLTHTSGFVAWIPLWGKAATREDTLKLVLEYKLNKEPGTSYTYSDLNMITLGVIVERLTGKQLDVYVKEMITDPLGMKDTMYNPPASLKPRIAATEFQPGTSRAIVWGEVHDENAYALGGVAGHAGVFSTAHDLAIFAHAIMNDGKYGNTRILKPETVKLMKENHLPHFPANKHSLAFELNLGWYMDALNDLGSLGHTGFTGTSMVLSPTNDTILLVLTNRVHPSRSMGSINPVRRDVARLVGDAIKVAIPGNGEAWFSGYGDNVDHELRAELNLTDQSTLTFDTLYSIQTTADFGYIEATSNGTTWTQIHPALKGDSQGWRTITAEIPSGTQAIRFRYKTVGTSFQGSGRGWYIQNVKATTANGELTPDLTSTQWQIRMD